MKIRNNILSDLKKQYLSELIQYYDIREGESILTILIEHYFKVSRNDLILNPDTRISESEILTLHMAVKELKKQVPVQYIIGEVEFGGLIFKVNPSVLIPRQETEELVNLITKEESASGLNILDIGTGSGCISITLAHLLTDPIITATDNSDSALKVATENASKVGVKVAFIKHDILDDNAVHSLRDKFDVIVSNPPYVTQSDKALMNPNVLDFEPHSALFVPEGNPLIYYNAIFNYAEECLLEGGRVYFEINESLANEMKTLAEYYGYKSITIHKDIHERDRMLTAIKD